MYGPSISSPNISWANVELKRFFSFISLFWIETKWELKFLFGKEQVHIWRRSYDTPPPNGESLKDVVERVSPYFTEQIEPLLIKEKNVLIVAHGNSLRAIMIKVGLYKSDEISSIELPTGSPLCLEYDKGKLINNYYLD